MSVDIYSKIDYNVIRKGILMKRTILFILVLLTLCSCKQGERTPTYETVSVAERENRYLVSHFEYLYDDEGVGSDWETGVKYGEREINFNNEIVFEGEELKLLLYAIEKDDKRDDVGEKVITFPKLSVGEEKTIIEFVEVAENGGAYKNRVSTWKFSVTLERLS